MTLKKGIRPQGKSAEEKTREELQNTHKTTINKAVCTYLKIKRLDDWIKIQWLKGLKMYPSKCCL